MHAVGMPGPMEVLMVVIQFVAGISGGQMPIGIPPQEEKPVFSQVAPEECIYYMSMAGVAEPDPSSPNRTEQFLAEPEVREFIKEVDSAIRAAIGKNAEDAPVGKDVYALVKTALTRPWCVFVSELEVNPDGPPKAKIGFLLEPGDDAAAVSKHLEAILNQVPGLPEVTEATIEGVTYRQYRLGDDSLTWGIDDGLFFLAMGDGVIEGMHERMRTPAPAWLAEMKEQLPVPRRATVTYVNLAALREAILPILLAESPREAEQIKMVVSALGLDKFESARSITGLDENGMLDRTVVEFDGPLPHVWEALVGESLTAEDLRGVPADANVLLAMKVDPHKVHEAIGKTADQFRPGMSSEIERIAGGAVAIAGFENVDAALGSLGKTWTIYNSPSEGGAFLTGLTICVEVNDSFDRVHKTLEAMLRMVGSQDESVPRVKTTSVDGIPITYLQFTRDPLPIAPAWTIHEGRLIVSLIPQNVRAALTRATGAPSIGSRPMVAKALGESPAPMGLFYADPQSTAGTLYPIFPYMAYTIAATLEKETGITFDAATVPALPTILPYVGPTLRTTRKTESGIEIESRSTVPGTTMSAGAAPVMVALLLPAVQASREAARRAQSMNNMKQIGLAMHNFHATKNAFPAAYSTDEQGKPLLSWRVHVLPYLEAQWLYEQFRLDEPWDSPHNKKLLPLMPQVYRSPNSTAAPGKTNYMTVRMEGSAFPGKEKIGIREIKDGTSNTIMFVEANDDSAVDWTKPDDFVPDEKNPMKGLTGLRPGGFNAALCDGSVRFISETLDKEVLKNLFQRNDGNPVPSDF